MSTPALCNHCKGVLTEAEQKKIVEAKVEIPLCDKCQKDSKRYSIIKAAKQMFGKIVLGI